MAEPARTATGPPAIWPAPGRPGPLFTDRTWLDLFADRIEGDHVWPLVEHAGDRYGLMGSVVRSSLTSEAKDVRRLLTTPGRSLRTLDEPALDALAGLAETVPGADEWLPSLIYLVPGFECRVTSTADPLDPMGVEALVDRALEIGDDVDAAVVAFLFVPSSEPLLHASLTGRGLRRFHAATESVLVLPGRTFEDYRTWLNSSRRADLRKAYQDVAERGTSFESGSLPPVLDELVEMLVAERVKHGRRPAEQEERDFLVKLGRLPGHRVHLTLARTDDRLAGFSIMLDTEPGVRHLMSQGIRDGRGESAALRLALNFYEPVRAAYRDRVGRLSFGYGSEDQKRRRGCVVTHVSGYLRVRNDRLRGYVETAVPAALDVRF